MEGGKIGADRERPNINVNGEQPLVKLLFGMRTGPGVEIAHNHFGVQHSFVAVVEAIC